MIDWLVVVNMIGWLIDWLIDSRMRIISSDMKERYYSPDGANSHRVIETEQDLQAMVQDADTTLHKVGH